MNHYNKYIKYKTKYLESKQFNIGGEGSVNSQIKIINKDEIKKN
jgi:hypothetical protein